MNVEQALAIVDEALTEVPPLRRSTALSPAHVAFVQSVGLELARIFGPYSAVSKNFNAIDYQSTGSFVAGWDINEEIARRRHAAYLRGLDLAEGILQSARQQLTRHGVDNILSGTRIRTQGPSVFVSHGKESRALIKLERYLRTIGAQPIIVVRGASEGMSVDDLVAKRMSESDCAIILATADEAVEGRRQPRPNVLHEIGLAQEKLEDRVIYLKEVGCDFPSNVQPKVWENFTQDNMEDAFEKVMKELRAFRLL